jgi:hypothetical protein
MIRPDDQVFDYFIYRNRIDKARNDVERFTTGYQFWLARNKDMERMRGA